MTKEEKGRRVEVEQSYLESVWGSDYLIGHEIYVDKEGNEVITTLTDLLESALTLESHLTP